MSASVSTSAASPGEEAAACTVYYDGACPLCRREIAFYQRQPGAGAIRWHDVAATPPAAADLDPAAALARFHVRRADGTLVSGARGFLAVMAALPRLRPLARLLSVPPLPWLAEGAYRAFLPLRPLLRRLVPPPATGPRNDAA